MKIINLPAGMSHVPCDDLALKISDALWPDDGLDDEGWEINHGCCWLEAEQEIKQAVLSGMLPVKKPTTFSPLAFFQGNAWKAGVVTIDDLRAYVADRGITVAVAIHSDSEHADLSYEQTYARATADIAAEFCAEPVDTTTDAAPQASLI